MKHLYRINYNILDLSPQSVTIEAETKDGAISKFYTWVKTSLGMSPKSVLIDDILLAPPERW